MENWCAALKWGFGLALLHRLVLLIWMGVIWLVLGQNLNIPVNLHVDPIAQLPALNSPVEQAVFGVWRRWDASHYLNLAQNGYRASDPGPTVFGTLTPLTIHLIDVVAPGEIDFAGMIFSTLAFGAALTLLYRVCCTYYEDEALAKWSVVLTALLPLAAFYDAPMSEALYLALALGVFAAGAAKRWWLAAVCGALAVLTRSQGILLFPVALLLIDAQNSSSDWRSRVWALVKNGWVLALIPLALGAFLLFRQVQGLPPLNDIYQTRSFVFFVDPLSGLLINLRWIVEHIGDALFNPDSWALIVTLLLLIPFLRGRPKLALLVYIVGHMLVFVTKVNWHWGSYDQVTYSQSYARYTLALFPFTVLLAGWLRTSKPVVRRVVISLSALGLLIFSALLALGGGAV